MTKLNTMTGDTKVSPLSKRFDETLDFYRISGKELFKLTGISESHISEFRRGKRDISTNVLFRLVDAMDYLAPGAGSYLMMRERQYKTSIEKVILDFIQVAEDDELVKAMNAIAHSLDRRNLRNTSKSQSFLDINECA